jgi:hypothetical protein
MKFEFKRHQINKIPREQIIEELEKVAKHFNYKDFKQTDFNQLSSISYFTVNREFSTWEKTMQFLKEYLEKKGIDFEITSRRSKYTIQEMFDEMERIWSKLSHRPSRNEWVASNPILSYDTICRQFGSWTKACLKFIEYKSGGEIISDIEFPTPTKKAKSIPHTYHKKRAKTANARTISLSVRLKVLNRDNFRCVFCGKSPATDLGTKLHIDHIKPFSQGGSNEIDNLQTLCVECNLGKSDRIITNKKPSL